MAAAACHELVLDRVGGQAVEEAEENLLLLEVQVGADEWDRPGSGAAVGSDRRDDKTGLVPGRSTTDHRHRGVLTGVLNMKTS